jgi:hypothetical protein
MKILKPIEVKKVKEQFLNYEIVLWVGDSGNYADVEFKQGGKDIRNARKVMKACIEKEPDRPIEIRKWVLEKMYLANGEVIDGEASYYDLDYYEPETKEIEEGGK